MNLHTFRPRVLVIALALVAAACGQVASTTPAQYRGANPKKYVAPPPPSPTPAAPALPVPAGGPLPGQNLPISSELPYPLLIQIENTPPSRPQAGIAAASMIFQYMTEGDITRFSAVFHRVPGVVGPVRSARFVSVYLYHHFDALMMASGAGSATYAKVFADPGTGALFNDFDNVRAYFFRWSGREAPHNVYTSQASMLTAAHHGFRAPNQSDVLRSNTWAGTESAPHVTVPFLRASFDFAGGTYSVITDGIVQNDVIYGDIRPHSVVVLHVAQTTTCAIHDVNGVCGRDFDLQSGGAAEMYANGSVIRGHWGAPGGASQPLAFTDAAGKPVGLPPGLSWMLLAE
ncbi:MAG: hypothetical protein QOK05_2718 [Chloroflexota bacterium]|jgi:hypothetical protein|nr:hypothetical protein [Chloroflexota bacterium]